MPGLIFKTDSKVRKTISNILKTEKAGIPAFSVFKMFD